MIGKRIFTGGVVVFWAVMMTALVRVEYFPRETRLLAVSTAQVMHKVFNNRTVTHLDLIYQNSKIGRVNNLSFTPLIDPSEPGRVVGYELGGDVLVNLMIFNVPSRFHLRRTRLHFDPQYKLKSFQLHTGVGGSTANIIGDNTTQELHVTYDLGDGPQSKQVKYAELGDGSALTALGLPGLPGLGALGMLGGGSPAKTMQTMASRLKTIAYLDFMKIGGADQRVYLVDTQMSEGIGVWVKTWIDEQGNILKVDSSLGMSLVSSAIDTGQLVDRTLERLPHKP